MRRKWPDETTKRNNGWKFEDGVLFDPKGVKFGTDDLLTCEQVAEIHGQCQTSVLRRVREGRLMFYKLRTFHGSRKHLIPAAKAVAPFVYRNYIRTDEHLEIVRANLKLAKERRAA